MVIMPQIDDPKTDETVNATQNCKIEPNVPEELQSEKTTEIIDTLAESNEDFKQPLSEPPENYLVETVDFPESPQTRKRLSHTETSFKDPLSNNIDEYESFNASSGAVGSDPCSSLDVTNINVSDEYFEDSLLGSHSGGQYDSFGDSELNMLDWSRTDESLILNASELIAQTINMTPSSNIEPASLQSNFSDQLPDVNLLSKIKDCFNQEKIKDLYVLSGRLQDILSPFEIEEIVMNSDLYTGYIDDEMFEVFSAAHAEQSSGFSRGGSIRDSRRKIKASFEPISDVQEDIRMRAVFECHTNSLRSSLRKKKPLPSTENIRQFFEDNLIKGATTFQTKVEPILENTFNGDSSSISTASGWDSELENVHVLKMPIYQEDIESNAIIDDCTKLDEIDLNDFPDTGRPDSLPSDNNQAKRMIRVTSDVLASSSHDYEEEDQKSLSSISNKSDIDVLSPVEDLVTPDDIDTPEDIDDSVFDKMNSTSEMIPELSAIEELQEERSWKTCMVGGVEQKIDMKVIEPYKKVLSHGGYFGPDRHAIIVFSACYLPDHSRRDYDYVMDNLFLYVLTTLEQLVAEDYILVYLHGATDRNNMPTFGWLKRCYQMIDRRLRKNLKGLYLVHPTFWLKTIVIMTRPFISSKFYRKLKCVSSLRELSDLIPMDHVCIPDKVKQYEELFPDL